MANSFATQAKVKQKFTAAHALVSKGLHTTQRLTSAHITATQSQAVPQETTPFQTRSPTKGKETLPVGELTLIRFLSMDLMCYGGNFNLTRIAEVNRL